MTVEGNSEQQRHDDTRENQKSNIIEIAAVGEMMVRNIEYRISNIE